MGTEAEATPNVFVPVVTVVVEAVVGRFEISTFTFREREEGPPLSEAMLLLFKDGSSTGTTALIWFLSSELACISISLRSSRSWWAALRAASWVSISLRREGVGGRRGRGRGREGEGGRWREERGREMEGGRGEGVLMKIRIINYSTGFCTIHATEQVFLYMEA